MAIAIRMATGLMLVALAACTTTDPYTGEQKASKTTKGAAIGAVSGAVIGAATASDEDRGKGAATGAGIGNYMDRQEKALRNRLEGSGVRVARDGDRLRLIMPGNITFGVDRDEVRSDFYDTLNSVATVLNEYDKTTIRVIGYTDSTGSDAYNQQLSERRAASVGRYLISQSIHSGRVQTSGYGERYPIASNDTEQGRQENRRVELELVPLSQ